MQGRSTARGHCVRKATHARPLKSSSLLPPPQPVLMCLRMLPMTSSYAKARDSGLQTFHSGKWHVGAMSARVQNPALAGCNASKAATLPGHEQFWPKDCPDCAPGTSCAVSGPVCLTTLSHHTPSDLPRRACSRALVAGFAPPIGRSNPSAGLSGAAACRARFLLTCALLTTSSHSKAASERV